MPQLTPSDRGLEIVDRLNTACPYSTAFLFLEPGCESIGQNTPLAKAIEAAMGEAFKRWEKSWIRPHAQALADAGTVKNKTYQLPKDVDLSRGGAAALLEHSPRISEEILAKIISESRARSAPRRAAILRIDVERVMQHSH